MQRRSTAQFLAYLGVERAEGFIEQQIRGSSPRSGGAIRWPDHRTTARVCGWKPVELNQIEHTSLGRRARIAASPCEWRDGTCCRSAERAQFNEGGTVTMAEQRMLEHESDMAPPAPWRARVTPFEKRGPSPESAPIECPAIDSAAAWWLPEPTPEQRQHLPSALNEVACPSAGKRAEFSQIFF